MNTNRRNDILNILVIAVPLVVYGIHVLYFGSWIVDDAGITFAYARNFVQGYGLVSQPQMPPVEGYSNFSWLLLIAPFFVFNGFDPVFTPKIISFFLIFGTFLAIAQILKPLRGWFFLALGIFTLTALNTSFVVWTISGLENALLVFLVSLLLWWSIRTLYEGHSDPYNGLLLGLLAALIGITRPDGLAFVLAFPLLLITARRLPWKRKGLLFLIYSLTFAGVFGLFIAFRLAYFGAFMPNTYIVKGGPEFEDLISLLTLQPQTALIVRDLLQNYLGSLKDILLILLAIGSLYLVFIHKWTGRLWATFIFTMCSLAIYILLPHDWMGEYRFATVFFPFFYLYCALIIEAVLKKLSYRSYASILVIGITIVVVGTFTLYAPRSEAFNRNPTISLQSIKTTYSDRFNWYSSQLHIENPSVLLPDVGAMIYYSDLLVYDLTGLIDQTIARYLGKDVYRPGFYNYVFEIIKPTFIHSHAAWTGISQLELDPRFAEIYVPICAYADPWVEETYQGTLHSGDFVLRTVAESNPEQIDLIQQSLDQNCNWQPPI